MTRRKIWLLIAPLFIVPDLGCPSGDDVEPSSTTTQPDGTSTGSTTTGDGPTTSEVPTTDGPTTAGAEGSGARFLYFVAGPMPGQFDAIRTIDDAPPDAPGAPETVLAAPDGGTLGPWYASPNGERLVVTGQGADQARHLYVIELATLGVTEVPLPGELTILGEVEFPPDGQQFMIRAAGEDQIAGLYRCQLALDGTCAAEPWSPPPVGDASGASARFTFSADGARVAFTGDFAGEGTYQLLLGDVDAPGVVYELAAFANGFTDAAFIQFSAGGDVLYYNVDLTTNSVHEFFAIDLNTDPPGPPVQLSPPVVSDAFGRLAPDLRAILWWTGDAARGDLSLIPIDGTSAGEPTPLNSDGPGRVRYNRWTIAPDGQRVAYLSDHGQQPDEDALYVVDVGGPAPTAPVRISAPLGPGGAVDRVDFAKDPQRAVYYAAEADAGTEIFLADLVTADAVKLNTPLPPGGSLTTLHQFAPDESQLVYQGTQEAVDAPGLYLVDLSGPEPGAPVRIDPPLPPGELQAFFVPSYSLDGERLYFQTPAVDGQRTVYRVHTDTPFDPIQLTPSDENVAAILVLPPAP